VINNPFNPSFTKPFSCVLFGRSSLKCQALICQCSGGTYLQTQAPMLSSSEVFGATMADRRRESDSSRAAARFPEVTPILRIKLLVLCVHDALHSCILHPSTFWQEEVRSLPIEVEDVSFRIFSFLSILLLVHSIRLIIRVINFTSSPSTSFLNSLHANLNILPTIPF
jgi:hypothetical protein